MTPFGADTAIVRCTSYGALVETTAVVMLVTSIRELVPTASFTLTAFEGDGAISA